MATVCGVSQTTIHVRLRELGLKTGYTKNYGFDENKIRKWAQEEHRTAVWIARQYGCHPSTVQLFLRSIGVRSAGIDHRPQGENANHWKGGKIRRTAGYVCVLQKNHPRADSLGYVPQHVLVMEAHIGRYLAQNEVVHHKNGVKDDNDLDNLQLMTDFEHRSHHATERHRKRRETPRKDSSASSIPKE